MTRKFCWVVVGGIVAGAAVVGNSAIAGNTSAMSQSGTVRFLVAEAGERVHGDSYVLPLSDADAIAHARSLIELGSAAERKIVSAWIAPGANGINRNLLAPGAPAWSWHVTGLREFTDLSAEIFDGWPTYVESDVEGWMENTEGQVGFWNYTVVAELLPGDYDADMDVDADDYAVWQAGFGGTVNLSADGSGNGIVDAADFVLWRQNYGRQMSLPERSAGPSVGVPEPAVLHLAFVGGVSFLLVLVRRRTAKPQSVAATIVSGWQRKSQTSLLVRWHPSAPAWSSPAR